MNPNIIIPKKGFSKKIAFINERNNIILQLDNILGFTNNNRSFYLYDLENDTTKQKLILDLIPEIKKYFRTSEWSCFSKDIKKQYLSLIKYIYKDMNFIVKRSGSSISINNIIIYTQLYSILKIN